MTSSPTATTLTPSTGVHGAANTTVTVTGTGFVSGATVHWGATTRPTTFVSATSVTFQAPLSTEAAAGSKSVTVVNPDSGTTAALTFTLT